MRITQNPYGNTSHHNHNLGDPKDYPIDSAGVDGTQSACFAPVDMKITAIKGIGSSATNTLWLVSTEKVKTPTTFCSQGFYYSIKLFCQRFI